jgi:hypothetical protein
MRAHVSAELVRSWLHLRAAWEAVPESAWVVKRRVVVLLTILRDIQR